MENHEELRQTEKNEIRYQGKRIKQRVWGRIWRDYGYLLVTVLVVVLVFRVFLQLAWVPTGSMETTIPARTLLVSWRLPYLASDPEPERGDVVTFWNDELGEILVKRVMGLPGDELTFSDGYVYVNGEKIEERYLPRQGITNCGKQESYQVPEGCFFVMGDNRTGSNDSRYLSQSYMPIENIKARVLIGISVLKNNSWRGVRAIT